MKALKDTDRLQRLDIFRNAVPPHQPSHCGELPPATSGTAVQCDMGAEAGGCQQAREGADYGAYIQEIERDGCTGGSMYHVLCNSMFLHYKSEKTNIDNSSS